MAASEQDILRRYLSERDVACPTCRYNLRGLVGDRCSECGRSYTLATLAVGVEARALVRACWGGFAYSLVAIALAAALIIVLASDALAVLALVLPGMFLCCWVVLIVIWAAAVRRQRVPRLLVVQLFTFLSWSIGTVLIMILFLMVLLGP